MPSETPRTAHEARAGDGSARQIALGVAAAIAQLERRYGHARLLRGEERVRTAEALGVFRRCAVIDIGGGKLATVGPRGGGLRIHDLRGCDA